MTVVTRFAPSPTGALHLGGARTAIFNWLYARKNGGKFILRIEDTDKDRNSQEHIDDIIEAMKWLKLEPDEICYSSANGGAHKKELLRLRQEEKVIKYVSNDSHNVYQSKKLYESDAIVSIEDLILGTISLPVDRIVNSPWLTREKDGSVLFLIANVIDDHINGVTHVIRGNDHVTNTFTQMKLFEVLGYDVPKYAHIPLIASEAGAKLSKRNGAESVLSYRDIGITSDAMFSYLLRLGWGYKDEDIVMRERALEIFDLSGVGKSPARTDQQKLIVVNKYYMNKMSLEDVTNACNLKTQMEKDRLSKLITQVKSRAKTLNDMPSLVGYLREGYINGIKAKNTGMINSYRAYLLRIGDWNSESIHKLTKEFLVKEYIKVKDLAEEVRLILTNSDATPSIYDVMYSLGKEETLDRLYKSV